MVVKVGVHVDTSPNSSDPSHGFRMCLRSVPGFVLIRSDRTPVDPEYAPWPSPCLTLSLVCSERKRASGSFRNRRGRSSVGAHVDTSPSSSDPSHGFRMSIRSVPGFDPGFLYPFQ